MFTLLGISETGNTLHDPSIEEKNSKSGDTANANNEDVNQTSKALDVTESWYQLKESTMTFYVGWQLFCLLIIVFAVYGTYLNM